ncbi:hypothetical protein PBV87_00640 [Niameybacter massiliensis]|uniref:Uncharacterized protein n=1 Tax=Holtiella tumoricola TaxID=3018743 RepID=A0AA42IYV2_9FIRM|nr:hypothetical protein [Holtiella tumoricola]MDA3730021.1 hypothetical protein [Holtiella tumoricola]
MRKAIAVLIMLGVCSIYFLAMESQDVADVVDTVAIQEELKADMNERIERIIEQIEAEYPATPKLLIEVSNEIMEVQYSEAWEPDNELEKQTLLALRLLCSNRLLELNTYNKQIENLRTELIKNHTEGVYLNNSKIESINFLTPDDAFVEVIYDTTKGTQKREYTLVKEEGLWKIYSWKDLGPVSEDQVVEE